MTARNPRWAIEHRQRLVAVRTCLAAGKDAGVLRAVAAGLAVKPATVRAWIRRHAQGELAAQAPGRKATEVAPSVRRGVILSICLLGPHASEEVLRGRHQDVPYRTIRKLKLRLGRIFRRRAHLRKAWLTWHEPGRVWAMDYTTPKARLDGPFKRLLLVRDLASGMQLAAIATTGETALAALVTLESLFQQYGAPLVLKSDNGKAFTARKVQALLRKYGVQVLFSPPYRPQYNGACERAGGHLKTRIENVAELAGRPGRWNVGDIEQGRWQANTTARPWGARGPTPAEAFEARRPLHAREREAFHETRALLFAEALLRYNQQHGKVPPRPKEAALERRATKRALLEQGYLTIRGGPISTPL